MMSVIGRRPALPWKTMLTVHVRDSYIPKRASHGASLVGRRSLICINHQMNDHDIRAIRTSRNLHDLIHFHTFQPTQ